MEDFVKILSHPFTNTLVTLILGTLLVLFVTQKWQKKNQKILFIHDYYKELNDVKNKIRLLRRKYRIAEITTREAIEQITEIENDLRNLKETTEITLGKSKSSKCITENLLITIMYFREISQEIENLSTSTISIKEISNIGNSFKSFISPKTEKYQENGVQPITNAKILLLKELHKIW